MKELLEQITDNLATFGVNICEIFFTVPYIYCAVACDNCKQSHTVITFDNRQKQILKNTQKSLNSWIFAQITCTKKQN